MTNNKAKSQSKAMGYGSWTGDVGTGRVDYLDAEKLKVAIKSEVWFCPECASKLKKLRAVHSKADEFYCHPCRISIPCFVETMGPVDPSWPPRNKE